MESREANHETEPQQQPSPPAPPLPQPQLPHNLQTETIILVDPNTFTNSTVPTTMMTPGTARFPFFDRNTNPSSRSPNAIGTVPQIPPSSTLMPCMTVVGESSSKFPSEFGSIKRKRGRPRKYFTENELVIGSGSSSGQAPPAATPATAPPPPPPPETLVKSTRGRGRPRGSFKKKNDVEVFGGLAGTCISPYLIIVNRGENIIAKVMSACRGGSNSEMCILSAHGSVSTVALHQTRNIAIYEGGPFEIISLSGTFLPGINNGCKRRGSWKVSLSGGTSEGHIWGGVVADRLIAASSVKVILGSFTVDGKKASSLNNQNSQPSVPWFEFAASAGISIGTTSQGHSSDSSGDNDNIPFDQGGPSGVNNNSDDQLIPNMAAMYQQMWGHHNQP